MKPIRSLCSFLSVATIVLVNVAGSAAQPPSASSEPQLSSAMVPAAARIWQDGIGEGFCPSAQSLDVVAGASAGISALGGRIRHDLALVSLSYGHMLGSVKSEGHWYRGNWEWRAELFAGAEFSPESTWCVGLTPHLRYDFATGTRWVPFVDLGAGVTATGEHLPDLGGTFEFNLQAGTGVHWFVRDNVAVTVEARYLHVSSAGLYQPNLGLNTVAGLVGVTWFF